MGRLKGQDWKSKRWVIIFGVETRWCSKFVQPSTGWSRCSSFTTYIFSHSTIPHRYTI